MPLYGGWNGKKGNSAQESSNDRAREQEVEAKTGGAKAGLGTARGLPS